MPEAKDKDGIMTRREFLGVSAVAAVALGAKSVLMPSTVLGANERINIAVIGVGGMGTGHLRRLVNWSKQPDAKVRVTAVCDVWSKRVQRAMAISGAYGYWDYRHVLERKDVDAILTATPDHWHAKISIDAMEAGKDVYCEKPMTLYWHQAKEVAETARRTNRVFQCGAQSANAECWRVAQRIIKNGGIGPTVWVEGGAFRNDPRGDWNWYIDPSANPSNLDWDMWLGWKWGLAPKRPWEPERYFRFRKFWDYSGGLATDLLYHTLSHLLIALGPKFPRRVVAAGGNVVFNLQNDNREVPENFHVLIEYPDNSVVVLEATQVCNYGVPEIIRGQHATMHFEGPGIVIRPQSPFVDQVTEKAEKGVYNVEGAQNVEIVRDNKDRVREIRIRCHTSGDQGEHVANWLECIRTRKKPNLDADTAYKVMVPIALSVESYRQQRAKVFDPEKEEVIQ